MSNFKSPRIRNRTFVICAVLALLVPLVLLAQGKKNNGNKGKSGSCETITADAEFRYQITDGIRSDGNGLYMGLDDTLVCLLTEQDHDFIMSTEGNTPYERASGVDRKVTLYFGANNFDLPPFDPIQIVDTLIRVDEVLSDGDYTNQDKRFIMWFKVGRDNYKLVYDNLDPSDMVSVTQTGTSPNRIWTIESTGTHNARLEKVKGKRYTVGHFIMPFQITVYETEKPPTCL